MHNYKALLIIHYLSVKKYDYAIMNLSPYRLNDKGIDCVFEYYCFIELMMRCVASFTKERGVARFILMNPSPALP